MTPHTPTAQAFLRVILELTRRIPPKMHQHYVLVLQAGERPRVTSRGDLVALLEGADLSPLASTAANRRTKPHEMLAFVESDEFTGIIAVPVSRPPGKGQVVVNLPTDAVLASLIGDGEPVLTRVSSAICSDGHLSVGHDTRMPGETSLQSCDDAPGSIFTLTPSSGDLTHE